MTDLVEVRDAENHDRLLGHIPRFAIPYRDAPRVYLATFPKVNFTAAKDAPPTVENIKKVTLNYGWHPDKDGWTMRKVFLTRDPLEVLLRLDTFSLPGEAPGQAALRRRYS